MVVLEALAQVPRRQRAALVLRYWEDLSLVEAADALGCSVGTVKSQCARGLARLRELLPADLAGEFRGGEVRGR
jgi:RNA polymerase sigma factor (sigma-70 family)